jgi:GNAT superfamily N-acetyltransferase
VPVTFRQAEETDIGRILQMMSRFYAREHLGYEESRAREAVATLARIPEYGGIWLVDSPGGPAGYFALLIGYSLEFHGRYGLIDELYLEPEWRGQGIGTRIISFAADWCASRGFKTLQLVVGHDNPGALRLYEREGFQAHRERLLMSRWL